MDKELKILSNNRNKFKFNNIYILKAACNADILSKKNNIFSCKKQQSAKHILVNGFSLIELMITLGVLCLFFSLAIPSFKTMILNNRLSAETDALVNALSFARSTALYQGMSVVVCPFSSLNSTSCGTNWSLGWIVVTKPAAGSATLLKSQQAASPGPILSSTVTSALFDPRGISTTQSNFKLCDTRGNQYARSVQVLPAGFVQVGNSPGKAVWDNSTLTCP